MELYPWLLLILLLLGLNEGLTGELKTPTRDQAAHYHLKVGCVESGSPSFVPANLFIPPDVYPLLTPIHKEYLRIMFGIQFLL